MLPTLRLKTTRIPLAVLVTITLSSLVAACSDGGNNRSDSKSETSFMLDTNVLPKHSIFYAAQAEGFYKKHNLNIKIEKGKGSRDTAAAVGAHRIDFGFSDFGTMVGARASGSKVKQLALIHAQDPFAVVTKASSDIHSWKDLKGKTVAGEPGGSTTVLFPIAEKLAGLKKNDVKVVHAAGDAKVPGLLAGKWDATLAYYVSDPPVLVGKGVKPRSLKWKDVGFDLYSNGLISSDRMISQHPKVVKRFVDATSEGVQWACQHQKKAARDMTNKVQDVKLKSARAGAKAACDILWTSEAKKHGLGYMKQSGVKNVFTISHRYLNVKTKSIKLSDTYTNKFNSGVKPDQKIASPHN